MAAAKVVAGLNGPSTGFGAMALAPDGKTLALANVPGKPLRILDAFTWKERFTLKGTEAGPRQALFSPDGKYLAVLVPGGVIRLWRADDGFAECAELPNHKGGYNHLAFSNDGQALAAGGAKEAVIWDLAQRKQRLRLHEQFGGGVSNVAFSPDGTMLATAERGGAGGRNVFLWDAQTGKERHQLDLAKRLGVVEGIAFVPGGRTLAVAGDQSVHFFNTATGQHRGHLKLPAGVQRLAYAPDGLTLAVALFDETVRLYDVPQDHR